MRTEKQKAYNKAWYEAHKEDIKERARVWAKNNRARAKENIKKYYEQYPNAPKGFKLQKYWPNLTWREAIIEYDKLFQAQHGCCKICTHHRDEFDRDLYVDHCHKTGQVRGLLCHNCNAGLGHFRDSKGILLSAISYLAITE